MVELSRKIKLYCHVQTYINLSCLNTGSHVTVSKYLYIYTNEIRPTFLPSSISFANSINIFFGIYFIPFSYKYKIHLSTVYFLIYTTVTVSCLITTEVYQCSKYSRRRFNTIFKVYEDKSCMSI